MQYEKRWQKIKKIGKGGQGKVIMTSRRSNWTCW